MCIRDSYICKPFSPREVVARVQAILRRIDMLKKDKASRNASSDIYRGIEVKPENFQAFLNGEPLDLTPVEFRMLLLLAQAPGRVFSRSRLMETIYEDGRVVSDRTVDSHVKNLRKKLKPGFSEGEVIHSIYGVGYKLE